MSNLRQRGFSAVEAIVIILFVAAIAGVGWYVFDRMKDDDKATTTTTQQPDTDAPPINDAEDLDSAAKTLDETDLDASTTDSSELDSHANAF